MHPLAEIGNTSWVSFGRSVYGGRNVANSGHKAPLVKGNIYPYI